MATLLYIDDEEVIGLVVSRYFEMRGDTVRLARSAAEARDAIGREAPAVIFLDVRLGAENGAAVMQWILDKHPDLASRVTFVTGEQPATGSATPTWAAFGRPVIRKPFDLDALGQALAEAENRAGT